MSRPEIPDSLREALKWAEVHDDIGTEEPVLDVMMDDFEWREWAERLILDRLQFARDAAAGRKKACRFAGAIDKNGEYGISGWTSEHATVTDDDWAEIANQDLGMDCAQSRGTVYLTLPVAEEVEAETDE